MVPPIPRQDVAALGRRLAGEVLVPGSAGYESKRKLVSPRFQHNHPEAIALCADSTDVAEVLAFAQESQLPLAVRSGGHDFIGRSTTEGIVLDLTPMHAVSVRGGMATVEPGARLGKIYDRLDEHQLTLAAGCGSTVGISGLTLGGGIGVFGRKHGLTCDSLLAAQVVLTDGDLVECDENRNPDLFWALRGGGGNFGVVTSLFFQTLPAMEAVTFRLTWRHLEVEQVLSAWQQWAPICRGRSLCCSSDIGLGCRRVAGDNHGWRGRGPHGPGGESPR